MIVSFCMPLDRYHGRSTRFVTAAVISERFKLGVSSVLQVSHRDPFQRERPMRISSFVLLVVIACEPAKSASVDRLAVTSFCQTDYQPVGDSLVDVTLRVDDTMSDYALQALCVRLDQGSVLLTNDAEMSEHGMTRHIRATRGDHTLAFDGLWLRAQDRSDQFQVHSAHRVAVTGEMTVRATTFELDPSAEKRPQIRWLDERRRPELAAP